MTDQPHHQHPGSNPDPAAAPPPIPDGTSAPVSGQPWSTPSGDSLSPEPYRPPQSSPQPPQSSPQPPQGSPQPPQSGPHRPQSSPQPPSYSPGYATIPPPPAAGSADYPPTSQFPPTGYPPPSYAPPSYSSDYGQPPGYGPPPAYAPPPDGYAYPPQPPPRRSNAPIIAVILAVALLLCGGVATAGLLIARGVKDKAAEAVGDLPTAVPELPGLPTDLPTGGTDGTGRQVTVTYEVTGEGPVSIVYIEKVGEAPKRLDNVKLPWKVTTKAEIPALVSIVVVRLGTGDGSVTCRALVDGDEVKKSESAQSNFATTNCTQLVLE